MGTILRNGWNEDRWNEESRLRQDSWDAGWKLVQEVFGKRGAELVTSQEIPEAERTSNAFMATFPAHNIPPPDRLANFELLHFLFGLLPLLGPLCMLFNQLQSIHGLLVDNSGEAAQLGDVIEFGSCSN